MWWRQCMKFGRSADAIPHIWLLDSGIWNDAGFWVDSAVWED